MKQHSISCEYPEGCSCGANEWNNLERDLRLAQNQAIAYQKVFEKACYELRQFGSFDGHIDRWKQEIAKESS